MSKLRRETLDNLRNAGRNQFENIAHPNSCDRFTTVGERYKRNDIRIHMYLRGGLSEFCAIFQHDKTGSTQGGLGTITPVTDHRTHASLDAYDLNKPMLVRIVDLFEPKEGAIASTTFGLINGFETCTTSAFVWLQPLDECLMFRSEQAKHLFTSTLEGLPPFPPVGAIPTQEDGELETSTPCNCFAWGMQECELIDKLVKGGTKVVGDLSDIDSPFKRRWRTIYVYAIDILSRLRIEIRPDDVILSVLPEGILHQTKSIDFSFCTNYLEARAIERMHMLYSNNKPIMNLAESKFNTTTCSGHELSSRINQSKRYLEICRGGFETRPYNVEKKTFKSYLPFR